MTLHASWIELNSYLLNGIWIQLNWSPIQQLDKIQLKRNEMQIGGEGIENLFVNMGLGKTPFHASLLGKGLNIFQFGIVQVMMMTYNLWNLKLFYLN